MREVTEETNWPPQTNTLKGTIFGTRARCQKDAAHWFYTLHKHRHTDKTHAHAHLLCVLLLNRLEVGTKIHGHFVFGTEQGAQDGVCRHPHPPECGPLKLPPQVQHLDIQIFDLFDG